MSASLLHAQLCFRLFALIGVQDVFLDQPPVLQNADIFYEPRQDCHQNAEGHLQQFFRQETSLVCLVDLVSVVYLVYLESGNSCDGQGWHCGPLAEVGSRRSEIGNLRTDAGRQSSEV